MFVRHAFFVRRARINRLSEKRADLLLCLANAREGAAAQTKDDRGGNYHDILHSWKSCYSGAFIVDLKATAGAETFKLQQ